jgi:hypothetical protein
MRDKLVPNDEAIKNLLIIHLLRMGVDPKIIENATGIAAKTIRNRFPMKLIKGEKENG